MFAILYLNSRFAGQHCWSLRIVMLTGATCRQQTRILEMHILVSPLSLVDRIYVSLSQNKIYEIISNYNNMTNLYHII